jgi:hypothetical protein
VFKIFGTVRCESAAACQDGIEKGKMGKEGEKKRLEGS